MSLSDVHPALPLRGDAASRVRSAHEHTIALPARTSSGMPALRIAAAIAAVLACAGCDADGAALDGGADASCVEVRQACACDGTQEFACGTPGGDFQCYPSGTWVYLADGCRGLDSGSRADGGR